MPELRSEQRKRAGREKARKKRELAKARARHKNLQRKRQDNLHSQQEGAWTGRSGGFNAGNGKKQRGGNTSPGSIPPLGSSMERSSSAPSFEDQQRGAGGRRGSKGKSKFEKSLEASPLTGNPDFRKR